ncbi:DUF2267 domain-containing protein [Robertkochia marina]|uniref:DUF2267 domain-containing protein n=1 Tax=Robertkochia marina TaxID=1227945 RepID=A0A4S3M0W9_9FLAO|nr:DUF2267 domain-containing protein [Robertkochia marina]THD66603.1 DUF2267 domain-containing protein [Robertkochia marina]TRZ45682.1 DUF2267 domain-containing protein [Robertkochia marina]
MALNFNNYATEGNTFIKAYAKDLDMIEDRDKAGRILISILHALREVIPVEESFQLIAQFPMFLKGVYVNGWSPGKKREKVRNLGDFIDLVRKMDGNTSLHDFGSDEMAENYILTTFIALRRYTSLGEMEDIRSGLPKELKHIVYHQIMF